MGKRSDMARELATIRKGLQAPPLRRAGYTNLHSEPTFPDGVGRVAPCRLERQERKFCSYVVRKNFFTCRINRQGPVVLA